MLKRVLTSVLLVSGLSVAAIGCSSDSDTPAPTTTGGSTGGSDAGSTGRPDAGTGSSTTTSSSTGTTGGSSDGGSSTGTTGSDAGGSTGAGEGGATGDAASTSDGAVTGEGGDSGLTPLQARGSYLVNTVIGCPGCHTPQGPMGPDMTKFLAGDANFVSLPNGDKLGTRNLTNDATGLKNRTDAEIKAMFMDGKRPTATGTEALNPVMPYYVFHNMTSADGDAIVAYLRTVPAVNNTIPRRSASFDVPAPANYLNVATIPNPLPAFADQTSAMRGKYLAAQTGVCIECHTKHLPPPAAPSGDAGGDAAAAEAGSSADGAAMSFDVLDKTKFFAGGEDFSAFFAATLMITPVSKNLTSDNATGLGTWTAQDIVTALTMGKSKDGTGICPPMPAGPGGYGGLTAADALDVANYIKSLPPVVNNVPDMCVFPPMMMGDGGRGDAAPTTDGAPSSDAATDSATTSDATSSSDAAVVDATGN